MTSVIWGTCVKWPGPASSMYFCNCCSTAAGVHCGEKTNDARWSHAHASDEGHASREGRMGRTTSAIDFSSSQVRRSGGMLQRDGSLLTSASLLRPCLA